MNLLTELPLRDAAGHVRVVVETPAQSRVKLKYDDQLGVFSWSRTLVRGTCFPYDFGFLPQTISGDGDALDALVFSNEQTYPGVVVPARVIGAMRIEQQRNGGPVKRNDRVLVVPAYDPAGTHLTSIADLPARICDELEQFFVASLALTGKQIALCGWAEAAEASKIVQEAATRYSDHS